MNTPTNYHDFRRQFLAAAQMRSLQVHTIQHRGLSPQGKPLFTDIASTVINPNLPSLIHISGVHGIEGYVGSLIQTEILNQVDPSEYRDFNIIFIHALNPWGMAWYRRVNGRGVDLNRNYFPDGIERPSNPEYEEFLPLFERGLKISKWAFYKQIFKAIFKNGLMGSARIIARGQYQWPEALFYGGEANEIETAEVVHFLAKNLSVAQPMWVIDVHTGLGKFASENWLLDGVHSVAETEFWTELFSDQVIDPTTNKKYYTSLGLLSYFFRNQFKDREVFYVYEEFGTRSLFKVFRALVNENKKFLKLKLDRFRAFHMIATFFPYEKDWRSTQLKKGTESFIKVLQAIQNKLKA